MPIYRDQRLDSDGNKRLTWYFKTTVQLPDGSRTRIRGTPGVPGPYHDLTQTRPGVIEAERRGIYAVLGTPLAGAATVVLKETPLESKTKEKTITEHAETFVDTYKPGTKQSEKREKRRVLKSHLLPYFGAMTIEGLKQEDVDGYAKSELDRGVSIKTVNNQLAVMSTLIRYRTGAKSRLRFKLDGMAAELTAVSSEDVERLLAVCDDDRYRAVILLASEAGLRAGEIRGLQFSDVKAGQLTVRRALDKRTNEVVAPKHNKARTVPLSPRLATALAELSRHGLWVIAEADGSSVTYDRLCDAVHAIYAKAKVARPVKALHCLRHTFGTVMARKVPLPVLQKLLGHADVKTTLRYIDVGEDDKRDAIALVFGPVSAACPPGVRENANGTGESSISS